MLRCARWERWANRGAGGTKEGRERALDFHIAVRIDIVEIECFRRAVAKVEGKVGRWEKSVVAVWKRC